MSERKCARCGYEHLSGENVRCCPFPDESREPSQEDPWISYSGALVMIESALKSSKPERKTVVIYKDDARVAVDAIRRFISPGDDN